MQIWLEYIKYVNVDLISHIFNSLFRKKSSNIIDISISELE